MGKDIIEIKEELLQLLSCWTLVGSNEWGRFIVDSDGVLSVEPVGKGWEAMGVKVGGEVLGPLLVLRDIASVLAAGVVVSHSVLVLKGSGEFWWVLGGSWCLGFEVFGSFWCFHWFLVKVFGSR
jgi:hypothetical protein